jgi:NitT/TauT family transport system ATP-binding protein
MTADRIVRTTAIPIVFSDRPARVTADIPVDRPYPRHRGDPHLAALRRDILGLLGLAESW